MNFRDLTQRRAVLAAIAECDALGREAFLEKYGFRSARTYVLVHDGRQYDSKAIVGAAYGFQFGTPLKPTHFSGGKATVRPKLESLGFRVLAFEIDERSTSLPEEVSGDLWEGARRSISVNAYERSPDARAKCIEYHGAKCTICGFDFATEFGDDFLGFIHVHHVVPMSEVRERYKVDPVKDLVPVCPNCHAVIHYGGVTRSVASVRALIAAKTPNPPLQRTRRLRRAPER